MSTRTLVSTGFKVPYEVKESSLGGVGLFVTERVPKGTLIWLYEAGKSVAEHDEPSLRARMSGLSKEEVIELCEHVYCWEGKVVEILDDGKLWNHSRTVQNTGDHPNEANGEGDCLSSYALRDIEAGEELLDDYSNYDRLPWFEQLCIELGAASCIAVGDKYE